MGEGRAPDKDGSEIVHERKICYKVPVISQAKDKKGKELIKKIYSSHVLNYEKV